MARKVRICARGDQLKSVELFELYSPVVSSMSLKLFLSIAGSFESDIHQFDVSTAFLYSRTEKPLFYKLPRGHPEYSKSGKKVWKAYMALYGLRTAPKEWNSTFSSALEKFGFRALFMDACFFFKSTTGKVKDATCILILYVDDAMFCGENNEVSALEKFLCELFSVKMKDRVDMFIGLEIVKNEKGNLVHQSKFIENIAKKFEIDVTRSYKVPMDPGFIMAEDTSEKLKNVKLFQSLLGSLNYVAVSSRPDIAFSVGVLSRKQNCPTENDLAAARRVLMYLNQTKEFGIQYDKVDLRKPLYLSIYSDSSHANDTSKRSIYGFGLCLNGNWLMFKSKLAKYVALNSTEAEYVGFCQALVAARVVMNYLTEFGVALSKSVLLGDNQAALGLIQNKNAVGQVRHVDINLQSAKELVVNGTIKAQYIDGEQNIADILTKGLRSTKFDNLSKRILTRDSA